MRAHGDRMPRAALRPPSTTRGRSRSWALLAASSLWVFAVVGLVASTVALDRLLRPLGTPFITDFAVGPTLACISAATVGVVVATRRPGHPVGWLLLGLAMSLALSGLAAGVMQYGAVTGSMTTPVLRFTARCYPITVVWAFVLLGLVLHLTPTGAAPTLAWRWWIRFATVVAVVSTVAALVLPTLRTRSASVDSPLDLRAFAGPLLAADRLALAVALLTVLTGVASLIGRFRLARGVEQQQLRWVALAGALTAMCVVAVAVCSAVGAVGLASWAASIGVVLLPPTIGASILRYRLYQVDPIISRVATYGALTLLLGATYGIAVVVSTQVLGRRSDLTVAVATLAVAAVARPLRRRVQGTVDRRFNRRRYDAQATLAGFAALLREELDLSVVRSTLSTVVHDTMQPTQVWLWMVDPSVRRPAGSPASGGRTLDRPAW